MSGSERTVALLVTLGLMVVVAEGWVGNFRDWVRATVGAQPSTPPANTTAPYEPGAGNGTGAVQSGAGLSGTSAHGTTSYPTF